MSFGLFAEHILHALPSNPNFIAHWVLELLRQSPAACRYQKHDRWNVSPLDADDIAVKFPLDIIKV